MDVLSRKRLFDLMAESEREYREFLDKQNIPLTPTPSPTLTLTPTPSFTPSPTPSYTATPSPTPTPTITSLPRPSPINNLFRFICTITRVFNKIFRNI